MRFPLEAVSSSASHRLMPKPPSAGIDASDALEPLRERFNSQHNKLRRFYYECANLKYLTALINVPKLPANPPSLIQEDGPDLPQRPATGAPKSPPPRAPSANVDEQARMLAEFEAKKAEQARLEAERDAEQKRAADLQRRQQQEFEEMQRLQAEKEKQAQDDLMRQQMMASQNGRAQELERDILAMRGQYERDQMMLEQYDRVSCGAELESESGTKLRLTLFIHAHSE